MNSSLKRIHLTLIYLLVGNYILLSSVSCSFFTEPSEVEVIAPSRTLPVKEIMSIQGINSIHYVDYYYVTVNGKSDSSFYANDEYYIDSCRYRHSSYYLGNKSSSFTVYDICQNLAWRYSSGNVEYLELPNWPAAYVTTVQARLGSWLQGETNYVGVEYIDGKLCDIYEDSRGYREWIWPQYKLPLQQRRESVYDVHQITLIQKRIIEINNPFPDSLFRPPKG